MRKIAIDAEYKRVERAKKRVGRPRFYWLQETMKRAYRLIRKKSGKRKKKFNIHSEKKRERVAKAANERAFPFDKRNKRNKLKRKARINQEIMMTQINTSTVKQARTTTRTIAGKIKGKEKRAATRVWNSTPAQGSKKRLNGGFGISNKTSRRASNG